MEEAINAYNEAFLYFEGRNGYPLNYSKAFELFEFSAEHGYSDAMNYLGIMCENGNYVAKDCSMAVNWYKRAITANTQNVYALYNLGRMYYDGLGVAKNMDEAYKYCKACIEYCDSKKISVYPKACYLLGNTLIHYYGDYSQAYTYMHEAADYGNIAMAWHNLGWLTEQGITCEELPIPDNNSKNVTAIAFYEKAGNLGYLPAMDSAGRLLFVIGRVDLAKKFLSEAATKGYEPAKKRLKTLNVSQGGSLWDLFKK